MRGLISKGRNLGNIMFSSSTGRVVYRFAEIFVLGGIIALYNNTEVMSLLPPLIVAILAGFTKTIRESRSK